MKGQIFEALVIATISLNTIVLAVGEPSDTAGAIFTLRAYNTICTFIVGFFVVEFALKLFAMGFRVGLANHPPSPIPVFFALRLLQKPHSQAD